MGIKTDIQWCDSTLNLQMGCNGCELWTRDLKHCYAGTLTEKYAGHKGFPKAFDKPQIFDYRMEEAEKWGDLTWHDRQYKPWLNKYPRMIFLNDMGDTFTEGLPWDWLTEYIPRMEATPHIYMLLTKRPKRSNYFVNQYTQYNPIPKNIWFGTSITGRDNLSRANELLNITGNRLFLSIEPLLEPISIFHIVQYFDLVIVGFESGEGCRKGDPDWARTVYNECRINGTNFFMKQMGGERNHHGDLNDLPEDLQIRQMPTWDDLEWKGKTPFKQIPDQPALFD